MPFVTSQTANFKYLVLKCSLSEKKRFSKMGCSHSRMSSATGRRHQRSAVRKVLHNLRLSGRNHDLEHDNYQAVPLPSSGLTGGILRECENKRGPFLTTCDASFCRDPLRKNKKTKQKKAPEAELDLSSSLYYTRDSLCVFRERD